VRAALYARVSRQEQVEGHSLDAQIDAMRELCGKRGWQVVGEYVDAGISGTTKQRPELQRLLADAEAGRLDVVVVHAIDRFFRNLRGLLEALDRLHTANVSFVSINENMDFTTPWGKLTLAVLGSLAEIFVTRLQTEVAKGKQARAKKGLPNTNRPPWGYVRIDGQDLIDEDKRPVVEAVFQMYATGAYSLQGLAAVLNEQHPKSGRRWTGRNVSYMISNPFYAGMVQYRDQVFQGQHEALIAPDLWDKAQRVYQRKILNPRRGRSPRATPTDYLLSGILVCHTCGHGMWTEGHDGKWYYYFCSAKRRGSACPESNTYVPMDAVHGQIEDLVQRIRLPGDWQQRIVELANYEEEQDQAERTRTQLQARITRLTNAYIWQGIGEDSYQAELQQLQAQLARLEIPDTPAIVQAGTYLESLAGLWPDLDDRERREVIHILFQEVRVDAQGQRIVCVQVQPEFIPLFRLDGMEEGEDGCFYLPRGD